MTRIKSIKEKHLFYSVLFFNLFFISTVMYYPSLDGPTHLYNSNAISFILKGNGGALQTFLTFNNCFIPNWTSHFIMSAICLFSPAWIAEKIFLFLYIIGMSVTFRLLIRTISPDNLYLSVLIFPFIYSFLFHVGFYNFSISFIFLFFALYYWIHNRNKKGILKHLILSFVILLCYYSNILTFGFLGLSLGLFIIVFGISDNNKQLSYILYKKIIKDLIILFLLSLPCLLFFIIFFKTNIFFPTENRYCLQESTKFIIDVKSLISFDYIGEVKITRLFFYLFIGIFIISSVLKYRKKNSKDFSSMFRKYDILLLPALLSLILYYIEHNGSEAGMMSDRYNLMFYMLLIIWMATQQLPKIISQIFMILVVILHLGLLFKNQNGTIRGLNIDALSIVEASKHVESNSIVLPIDMTDNWLEKHFSNYLGINKPLILLENYEASVNWFPLKLNNDILPNVQLGNKDIVSGLTWITNPKSSNIKQIDYVLLYGIITKINDNRWLELKNILNQKYNLVYSSPNNYIGLYNNSSFKTNLNI